MLRGSFGIVLLGLAGAASVVTGQTPEKVAPGVVSLDRRQETFPAVDPVDGSLWFSTYARSFADQTIVRAPAAGAGWGPAETAPFSGRWGDRAPRFSPDGRRLFFTSNRPRPGRARPGDMNIWMVERLPDGGWSEAAMLPEPVNSPRDDIHASIVEGALYVASDRAGVPDRSGVYRVAMDGDGWGPAEAMPFNDAGSTPDLLVDPAEGWIILAITDHPQGLGGDDLFLVRRTDAGWGRPEHLPGAVNSEVYDYGPTLSPDGRWLYFTSHRDGTADVFRVPTSELALPGRP